MKVKGLKIQFTSTNIFNLLLSTNLANIIILYLLRKSTPQY